MPEPTSDESRSARKDRLARLFDLHRQVIGDATGDALMPPLPRRGRALDADAAQTFLQRATQSLNTRR